MTEIRKCECKNVINGKVCGFEYISYGSNKGCPACKSIEHNVKEIIFVDVNDIMSVLKKDKTLAV